MIQMGRALLERERRRKNSGQPARESRLRECLDRLLQIRGCGIQSPLQEIAFGSERRPFALLLIPERVERGVPWIDRTKQDDFAVPMHEIHRRGDILRSQAGVGQEDASASRPRVA